MMAKKHGKAYQESLEIRSILLLHLSKISFLEGQVEALLKTVHNHALEIRRLKDKQIKLDGLRANLS